MVKSYHEVVVPISERMELLIKIRGMYLNVFSQNSQFSRRFELLHFYQFISFDSYLSK